MHSAALFQISQEALARCERERRPGADRLRRQNAANARAFASSKMDRSAFLAKVAAQWAQLDLPRYPSVYKAGTQLREHEDREQLPAGIDLILASIQTVNRAAASTPAACPAPAAFRAPRPSTRG
jgi:hypothetical protein